MLKTLFEINRLLLSTKGKFFTVLFTKQDGTERYLNGRLDVRKGLADPSKAAPQQSTMRVFSNFRPTITVYDMQEKGYRSIRLDSIKAIKFNGIVTRYHHNTNKQW